MECPSSPGCPGLKGNLTHVVNLDKSYGTEMCTFLCSDLPWGPQAAFSLLTPHWLGSPFIFLDFLLLVSQEFHFQAFVYIKLFQVT